LEARCVDSRTTFGTLIIDTNVDAARVEARATALAECFLRALRLTIPQSRQTRTYLLNQSIVRCHARSAAALLYRSGVASQLKP
jgi:hypothetical protein